MFYLRTNELAISIKLIEINYLALFSSTKILPIFERKFHKLLRERVLIVSLFRDRGSNWRVSLFCVLCAEEMFTRKLYHKLVVWTELNFMRSQLSVSAAKFAKNSYLTRPFEVSRDN